MNKYLSLSLILLTATFNALPNSSANNPSCWQVFISFFWANPQSQENPDQAPANITIDNYIAQFRSDLNGNSCIIPHKDMHEMETTIRQELEGTNLRDKEQVNNIIRTVLINQVKVGSQNDIASLIRHEDFYVTPKEYHSIANSYENNMIARLGRMPHLNGAAIAQYFGETRKNEIRNSLANRTMYQ